MNAVDGDKELINKLKSIEKLNIKKALDRGAIIIENQAKQNCPVDTGELRRSITHESTDEFTVIGSNVFYAPYICIGTGLWSSTGDGRKDIPWHYQDDKGEWHTTVGSHPHPFLAPALHQKKREAIVQIYKELERQLREIAKK